MEQVTVQDQRNHQQQMQETLARAFQGSMRPVRVSFMYQAGLFIVAAMMILLPLLYLALILGIGALVVWHAVTNITLIEVGGSVKGRLLIYFTPILAGSAMILFMLKPFFARRIEPTGGHYVFPRNEPLLFYFVEQLCTALGAPTPNVIQLSLQVSAAAYFQHGFKSLFTNELGLIIGLPVVQGLTVQHLAAILAHEFGHFSQRAGMRLHFIIMTINRWFYRVVYERDAWDLKLEVGMRNQIFYIIMLSAVIRLGVWLSRRVLWCLMWVGHVISSFLSRQMEYNADLHAIRLTGSKTQEELINYMTAMSAVEFPLHIEIGRKLREEQKYIENFPKVLVHMAHEFHQNEPGQIEQIIQGEQRSLFDTHPTLRQRIDFSNAQAEPGIFQCDAPAKRLFSNLQYWAVKMTRDNYENA